MRKMTLQRIDVYSAAKIEALLLGVAGLIAGVFMALASLFLQKIGFGIAGIIILPIMYAILGFVGGAIGAWIYNMCAEWIGGIKLEFKE